MVYSILLIDETQKKNVACKNMALDEKDFFGHVPFVFTVYHSMYLVNATHHHHTDQ